MEHKLTQNILIATMGLNIGGAETHVIELSKGLSKMGLKLFVASNGGAYETELAKLEIPHFCVPLHNKRPLNVAKAYRALEKIITQNNIELVHAHARIPAFLCGLLQKKLKFRLVTTAHFNFINIFPYNLLTNWGEKTLAVSYDLKTYLVKNYKTPDENIIITVNGIDTDKFCDKQTNGAFCKEYNLDDDTQKVICVTRLDKEPSKIAFTLAEAAKALYKDNPKLRVIIIGDGNNRKAVKQAADKTNLETGEKIVILAGARTDIDEILPQADVIVGISRSALEGMAACKPVILAGGYGALGIFDENILNKALSVNFTCRGANAASRESLASDIALLLSETKEQRKKRGEYGRTVVKEHYSVTRMCKDAAGVYESVLNTPYLGKTRANDVLLFGYYGSGNNGDDALLKSILHELKTALPELSITALSRKPRETAAIHNIKTIYLFNLPKILLALKKTKLLISGGGTLLQDITSTRSLIYYLSVINHAKRRGAMVMLYANGLGPVKREKNKERIIKALNNIDCITLRDSDSLKFLETLYANKKSAMPPATLAADVAFSLVPGKPTLGARIPGLAHNKDYFVVSLRRWKYSGAGFVQTAAAFCDYINETYGLTAVFIPMQASLDTAVSKKVLKTMKTKGIFHDGCASTDDILSVISDSRFVFSMRLHTIIYAAKAYIPAIAVVYDPKVESMMNILSENTFVHASAVDLEKLKGFGDTVMQNRDELCERIKQKTLEQTALAGKSRDYAISLLKKEGDIT